MFGNSDSHGFLPEHDDLPAMIDLGGHEEPAHLQLREVDRGPVLRRAEDRDGFRLLVAVIDAGLACCRIAPSQTSISATDGHSRSIATRILPRQVRTARDFEEALARREAERAPLLHHDGVRAELADRIAQRVVEPADERRHADDRRDADDHAEHGQRRAHLVRAQRVDRHRHDLAEQAGAECSH